MKNKVVVEVFVPSIEERYDIYIPVNRKIGSIINLICKAIMEMMDNSFEYNSKIALYNSYSGIKYNSNDILRKTDIRNGSKLILM